MEIEFSRQQKKLLCILSHKGLITFKDAMSCFASRSYAIEVIKRFCELGIIKPSQIDPNHFTQNIKNDEIIEILKDN